MVFTEGNDDHSDKEQQDEMRHSTIHMNRIEPRMKKITWGREEKERKVPQGRKKSAAMWLTVALYLLVFKYEWNVDDTVSDGGTSFGGQYGVRKWERTVAPNREHLGERLLLLFPSFFPALYSKAPDALSETCHHTSFVKQKCSYSGTSKYTFVAGLQRNVERLYR